MPKYKVKMVEQGIDGRIHTLNQIAVCESREQVIKFYGLTEPDILEYDITEIEE